MLLALAPHGNQIYSQLFSGVPAQLSNYRRAINVTVVPTIVLILHITIFDSAVVGQRTKEIICNQGAVNTER